MGSLIVFGKDLLHSLSASADEKDTRVDVEENSVCSTRFEPLWMKRNTRVNVEETGVGPSSV